MDYWGALSSKFLTSFCLLSLFIIIITVVVVVVVAIIVVFREKAQASFLYTVMLSFFVRFYGPVNPWTMDHRARSFYLATHLLGRFSPLSG